MGQPAKCQKCDQREGSTVALLGGFSAWLCRPCRNGWHRYLAERGLWSRYKQIQSRQLSLNAQFAAGTHGLEGDLEAFFAEQSSLMIELFDVAESWIAAPTSNA